MAAPPRQKQLIVDVPADADEWFSPFLDQLNSFILSTTTALQASLTRAQNFSSQRYTLQLTTGASVDTSFPVSFNCTLPTQPEEVRLTQATSLDSDAFDGAAAMSHWDLSEGSTIKIYNIAGLKPNKRYTFYFTIT